MKKLKLIDLILMLCCISIFVVIQTAKVRQTFGDSQLTLLTSQSILEKGDVNLSSYYNQIPNEQFSNGSWKFRFNENKNQIEYIYPLGNSLFLYPLF